MSWGQARRPKIEYGKATFPNPREGSDGDIQVRQTNLGAKLFGKVGGTWYGAPLTSTEGNQVTRIGVKLSDHIAIDKDSIDIYKNSVKVAEFGSTVTIGSFEAASNGVITVAAIELSGKIALTSTGTQNICIGTGNNDDGTNNIAIGVSAGRLQEGDHNISIGTEAGYFITSADENILIGSEAGKAIQIDLGNVLIGAYAGNLLKGTSVLSEGYLNTVLGTNSGQVLVTGSGNTYIGARTKASGTAVTNEVVLAGADHVSLATIGKGSNTILLGNTSTTYVLPDGDNRTELGSDALEWEDIWATSGSVNSSDERLKENIQDLSMSGLEKINALRPRTFDWKKRAEVIDEVTKITHKGNGKIGFIAQEVQSIIPELIIEGRGEDDFLDEDGNILIPKGTKSLGLGMSGSTIMAYIVKAVQELSAKLDTMQTEINNLKAE